MKKTFQRNEGRDPFTIPHWAICISTVKTPSVARTDRHQELGLRLIFFSRFACIP